MTQFFPRPDPDPALPTRMLPASLPLASPTPIRPRRSPSSTSSPPSPSPISQTPAPVRHLSSIDTCQVRGLHLVQRFRRRPIGAWQAARRLRAARRHHGLSSQRGAADDRAGHPARYDGGRLHFTARRRDYPGVIRVRAPDSGGEPRDRRRGGAARGDAYARQGRGGGASVRAAALFCACACKYPVGGVHTFSTILTINCET